MLVCPNIDRMSPANTPIMYGPQIRGEVNALLHGGGESADAEASGRAFADLMRSADDPLRTAVAELVRAILRAAAASGE